MHPVQKKHPAKVDAPAVRMALDRLEEYRSIWATAKALATVLELGPAAAHADHPGRLRTTSLTTPHPRVRSGWPEHERQGLY